MLPPTAEAVKLKYYIFQTPLQLDYKFDKLLFHEILMEKVSWRLPMVGTLHISVAELLGTAITPRVSRNNCHDGSSLSLNNS